MNPGDFPAGPDDPELEREWRARERAFDGLANPRRVVGMNQPGKSFHRPVELLTLEPVDRVDRVGPGDPVPFDIPLPDADVAGLGGDSQPLLRDEPLLGFPFHEPPRGDVAEDQDHPDQVSVAVADRGRAVIDGALSAVPGDQDRVIGQTNGHAGREHLGHRVLDGLPGQFIDDPEHPRERLSLCLGDAPAGQLFGHRIEHGDPAGRVGGDHRVADAGQSNPQLLVLSLDLPGRCLGGLPGRSLGREPALGCFRLAPFGDVASDLPESPDRARLIPEHGHHHAGKELRSVLPDSPGLFLVLALPGRGFQGVGRLLTGLVFGSVEAGEMLADDFIGPIPLDALGPGIPGGDPAIGVQHEDRVLPGALDEEAEPLFAGSNLALQISAVLTLHAYLDRERTSTYHGRLIRVYGGGTGFHPAGRSDARQSPIGPRAP